MLRPRQTDEQILHLILAKRPRRYEMLVYKFSTYIIKTNNQFYGFQNFVLKYLFFFKSQLFFPIYIEKYYLIYIEYKK
ncbi:hypothetical protein pb186bvf_010272 [Paramecium bursaria]